MAEQMDSNKVTRWWWVRHAPVVDYGGRIYGQRDVPCDTSDEDSFRALAGLLPEGAVWVTSHLQRAKATAATIRAAGLVAPEPLEEVDFAEQSFGDWEGSTWDDIKTADGKVHEKFWHSPLETPPPGGESFADLIARVAAVIDRLNDTHRGRDIVAVTHGGTIRAAVALALALPPEHAIAVRIDNLSLTRLDHVPERILQGLGGVWRVNVLNRPPR